MRMHGLFNAHCNRSWMWFKFKHKYKFPHNLEQPNYADYRAMYMMGGEL